MSDTTPHMQPLCDILEDAPALSAALAARGRFILALPAPHVLVRG